MEYRMILNHSIKENLSKTFNVVHSNQLTYILIKDYILTLLIYPIDTLNFLQIPLKQHEKNNLHTSPVLIQFLFSFVNNHAMVFLCVPNILYAYVIRKKISDDIQVSCSKVHSNIGTYVSRNLSIENISYEQTNKIDKCRSSEIIFKIHIKVDFK